jgi:altronate dehydratase large subunit
MTYQQMEDNMDINASTILDGSESLNSVGQRIYESIIDTANGKKTKAEALGYRDYIVFCRSRAAEHMLGHC